LAQIYPLCLEEWKTSVDKTSEIDLRLGEDLSVLKSRNNFNQYMDMGECWSRGEKKVWSEKHDLTLSGKLMKDRVSGR
jgi:hypothetical protein